MASAPVVSFDEKQKNKRENFCIVNDVIFEGVYANPCDTVFMKDSFL
jgi:hypothetical protein